LNLKELGSLRDSLPVSLPSQHRSPLSSPDSSPRRKLASNSFQFSSKFADLTRAKPEGSLSPDPAGARSPPPPPPLPPPNRDVQSSKQSIQRRGLVELRRRTVDVVLQETSSPKTSHVPLDMHRRKTVLDPAERDAKAHLEAVYGDISIVPDVLTAAPHNLIKLQSAMRVHFFFSFLEYLISSLCSYSFISSDRFLQRKLFVADPFPLLLQSRVNFESKHEASFVDPPFFRGREYVLIVFGVSRQSYF
jgi:hypothetical protein